MRRKTWMLGGWLIAALATAAIGCGDGTDEDAGVDASGGGDDAGPGSDDAGPGDAGNRDAGPPPGCVGAGCEFVQINTAIAHSCGVRGNGEVMCWGRNQEFQLGDGRTRHMDCSMPGSEPEDCSGMPVNVRWQMGGARPIVDDATFVTARAFSSTCSLRNGELWCWSNVVVNEVGGGNPEPLQVAERLFDTVSDVQTASVAGSNICYAQGASRQLFCAGSNARGQLGIGTFTETEISPMPVMNGMVALEGIEQIEVSFNSFACARTADEVYCWGRNREGQLGDGMTAHQTCVVDVTESWDCSNVPVVVGDPMTTSLGQTFDLATGRRHACAIQGAGPMGQVVCWGDNRAGAVGVSDISMQVRLPTPVAGMDDVIDVAAGSDFTCALHAGGNVECWGINSTGQLGDGMVSHGMRCMVGSQNEDCSPTPVAVTTIDDATALSAGSAHVCVIRGNGSVWCWGNNTSAQVGDGTRDERNEPQMVLGTDPTM